jgi:hypothetical protein
MKYVRDASAALCWVLPRPNSGKALQLRADVQNAVHERIAPSIFSGEVASALTKAERQKFIAVGDARPLLGRVMRTPPVMHPSTVARPGGAYLLPDPKRAVRLPLISRLPPMRTTSLASPPYGSRASIQSARHRVLARVYKTALRFGEPTFG